jgi:hypothetical protein
MSESYPNPQSAERMRSGFGFLRMLPQPNRTLIEDFDLENANTEAIEKIIEENDLVERGFRIEEIA